MNNLKKDLLFFVARSEERKNMHYSFTHFGTWAVPTKTTKIDHKITEMYWIHE